jgi:hypothetical protein
VAIIQNTEVWFVKANPARPNNKFNKKNPTWECQIRTSDKDVKKAWEAMKLSVKAVVPDEGSPYWRVNLRKKSIKEDGEASSPVKVVSGSLKPLDPDTIGNGSIANVRIYQYEYDKEGGGKGTANVLMGIQVLKHIVYVPKARDDEFSEAEMETVGETGEEDGPEGGGSDDSDKY